MCLSAIIFSLKTSSWIGPGDLFGLTRKGASTLSTGTAATSSHDMKYHPSLGPENEEYSNTTCKCIYSQYEGNGSIWKLLGYSQPHQPWWASLYGFTMFYVRAIFPYCFLKIHGESLHVPFTKNHFQHVSAFQRDCTSAALDILTFEFFSFRCHLDSRLRKKISRTKKIIIYIVSAVAPEQWPSPPRQQKAKV